MLLSKLKIVYQMDPPQTKQKSLLQEDSKMKVFTNVPSAYKEEKFAKWNSHGCLVSRPHRCNRKQNHN